MSQPLSPTDSPPRLHPLVPPGFALGTLLLSLFFFCPHLWIVFGPPAPGSTIWARGTQFILQCEHPFRPDLLDQGLVWRLAPALLGHVLHLRGNAVFLVPWAGLAVLLCLTTQLAWRFTRDLRSTWLFTALLGTTSATLTVTGWLGFNDAWYASALLLVAFQPQTAVLAACVFLGPWIDERFVLALPLAFYVHHKMHGPGRLKLLFGLTATSVGLYLAIRVSNPWGLPAGRVTAYLANCLAHFHEWLPWTTLGWFMSLRAVWLLVLAPLVLLLRDDRRGEACLLSAVIAAPLACITLVAADLSRAPTMLLPLAFLGLAQAVTRCPPATLRWILAGLLAANLLMPSMHVTYKYSDVINMLPIEVARLLKP